MTGAATSRPLPRRRRRRPLVCRTNNFSFSVFPHIFILFRRFPSRKSLFRPLAAIKPKACYAPAPTAAPPLGAERGKGSRSHFDRANCLNPAALFAKLCTVPRKFSTPVLLVVPRVLHVVPAAIGASRSSLVLILPDSSARPFPFHAVNSPGCFSSRVPMETRELRARSDLLPQLALLSSPPSK